MADSSVAVLEQGGESFDFQYLDPSENPLRTLISFDGEEGLAAVEVRRPRYREWRMDGVTIDFGPCTARTTDVTARLQPLAE